MHTRITSIHESTKTKIDESISVGLKPVVNMVPYSVLMVLVTATALPLASIMEQWLVPWSKGNRRLIDQIY